jgi:hypothetical protein
MATNQLMPKNQAGWLGECDIIRRGDVAPALTVDVIETGGRVRYKTGDGESVILKPTDRKTALIVMEDYSVDPERQRRLHDALKRDRWQRIDIHG